MATHRALALGLSAALALGGWSRPSAPRDPDVGENWYPLACRVFSGQLEERVGNLQSSGRIDASDALLFEAAIRHGASSCASSGFDTLRLLISLGDALTDWHATGSGM